MTQHNESMLPYFAVFGALLLLTGLTVGVAYLPIGRLHMTAAVSIAVVKSVLVVLFFMHALHSSRLTYLIIGAALLMLFILFALTLADYVTR